MVASDKELEQRLEEAGNELLNRSSSVEELLSLLDKVHDCLSKVEQSPPISMQKALAASQKALVADNLLKHPDEDVKVAVAASISEVTRITAPDAPYEDEQMKAVFQLIVSSFENLFDMSSRSYAKRTSILETVAKVRSCVVMLDLECDALVTEMFRHFLKAIRDYHPDKVFKSMETIMNLVIEESEDISPELLTTILDHATKDNEEVLPISRKLAEGVLQSCASKLKPYLIETVKSMGLSLDNYSNVVASICQGTSVIKEQNDIESDKLEKVKQTEVVTPDKVDIPNEGSAKSAVSNGVVRTGESHSMADSDSTKKQEDDGSADEPKKSDILSEADPVKKSTEEECDIGEERKSTTKKAKEDDAANQTESSKSSNGEEMESKTLVESKDSGKDLHGALQDDPSANTAAASENEKEFGDQVLASKQMEVESADVASPSSRERVPDEKLSKKAGNQKKKDNITEDKTAPRVASEAVKESEPKPTKKSGKKVASGSSNKKKPTVGSTKKASGVASKSKAKTLKSEKEDEESDDMEESSKQEDTKGQGRGKTNSSKDSLGTSSKDDDNELVSSPKSTIKSSKDDQQETPKENSKRKRSLGKEKASGSQEYGENLIGSKIKVYWPIDRSYYEGVVDSYDAAKKRHLVLYDDGDQEILYLKKQKWEFIQDDPESTGEEAADTKSPESKSEPSRKKAKTGSGDQSAKPGKTTASAKRGGVTACGKSKSSGARSGKNTKDGDKMETKSKEASTTTAKMDTDSDDEATEDEQKLKSGGGSKSKGKAAEVEVAATPKSGTGSKASGKSKEETPKSSKLSKAASTASKTKPGKPNANRSGGKSKSAAPSKGKESLEEDSESSAEDTPKSPEAPSKGKAAGSSKGKGSQAKWGKKRKR